MEGLNPMFPQYFPVFDYGHVASGAGSNGDMYATSPMSLDGDYGSAGAGRSYSPENTMQTAWQDFVAQMGM